MYQPYPTGAKMPVTPRPPVPRSVANAVKVMYVGALTNILGIVIVNIQLPLVIGRMGFPEGLGTGPVACLV